MMPSVFDGVGLVYLSSIIEIYQSHIKNKLFLINLPLYLGTAIS